MTTKDDKTKTDLDTATPYDTTIDWRTFAVTGARSLHCRAIYGVAP